MGRQAAIELSAGHVANIVATALDATDEERAAGMLWYSSYGEAIANQAEAHGWGAHRALALFACLSPRQHLARNWRLFMAGIVNGTLEGQRGMFPAIRRKAEGLCNGTVSIEGAVKGDKVSRFYRNLCGDLSCVTVDTHAVRCAEGPACGTRKIPCKAYRSYEAAYKVAAAQLGMEPAQCQAITWIVWRRQHGSTDNGGLHPVA